MEVIDPVFSTQITLHNARKAEVYREVQGLMQQARASCDALIRGGWRGEACRSIQLQVAAARREAVRKGLDENHLFLPKEVRPQVARFIDLLHEASHEFELATSLGREDLRAKDAMRRARRVVEREAPTIEVAVRRCFGPTIQPQFPVVSNDC